MQLNRFLLASLLAMLFYPSQGEAYTTSVRNDGVILRNGSPFYPFGFYFDGYNIAKSKRLADMATMAAAGFNTIATNIDNNDGPLFSAAAGSGMGVLMEFNDPNDTILQQVERWKANPALLGWQIADDVDNGRKTSESVRAAHDSIKAADSTHITYVSGGHPNPGSRHDWIGNFMGVSDTIAMQTYPVPNEQLSATNGTLKAFVGAAPANKSLLANIQSFAWEGERAPTPQEARNMTYQAYVNGMKGIIFYTFRSDYWSLTANAPLWSEFQALADENAAMAPWLLNGKMTRQVDTGAQRFNVFCSYWLYDGKIYVMLVNVSNQNRNTEVVLPEGTSGVATPVFAGAPATMSFNVQTRKLTGNVVRGSSHLYQLDFPQAAAAEWTLYD